MRTGPVHYGHDTWSRQGDNVDHGNANHVGLTKEYAVGPDRFVVRRTVRGASWSQRAGSSVCHVGIGFVLLIAAPFLLWHNELSAVQHAELLDDVFSRVAVTTDVLSAQAGMTLHCSRADFVPIEQLILIHRFFDSTADGASTSTI